VLEGACLESKNTCKGIVGWNPILTASLVGLSLMGHLDSKPSIPKGIKRLNRFPTASLEGWLSGLKRPF
jgi:hypothetical protein